MLIESVQVIDGGSTSGKGVSANGHGSVLAECEQIAPYDEISLTGNSYDIEIAETPQGRIAKGKDAPRWVIGQSAGEHGGIVERFDRGLDRYNAPIFYPMVCAMLAIMNPNSGYVASRDSLSQGFRNKSLTLVASIAPSYIKKHQQNLIEALKGNYSFVVRGGGGDYISEQHYRVMRFTVDEVYVIPEGFGIYQLGAFRRVSEGNDTYFKYTRSGGKVIAVGDWGGRTSDIEILKDDKIVQSRSFDTGLVKVCEEIAGECLDRFDLVETPQYSIVMDSIAKAKLDDNGQYSQAMLPVMHGEQADISDIVNRRMRPYHTAIRQAYNNILSGGTGIDELRHGGGCAKVLEPLLRRLMPHKNFKMVSSKPEDLWMANAVGAFSWIQYKSGAKAPIKKGTR